MSRTDDIEVTLQTHPMRFHKPRDKICTQGRPTAGSETPERLPTTDFACKVGTLEK